MKRLIAISIMVCLFALTVEAQSITFWPWRCQLETSLNQLNVSAKVNMQGFQAEVSLVWGQPQASVTVALSQGLYALEKSISLQPLPISLASH